TRPESFFADRFNVTGGLLERVLGSNLLGRADDADIYLEYRVNEELQLEEGTVKKASRHVSQGAGVRALSGTRTGYAHTDDISLQNLEEAARQARAIAYRARGGAPGRPQARRRERPGRDDDRRAGPGLARHPAARGRRSRARGRLQPQGDVGVRRTDGPEGRLRAGDRDRRRDDPEPPRLAERRRRGHADRADGADREGSPRRLHAGPPERTPHGDGADRQRTARVLRIPADAPNDQHLHVGGRGRAGADHQ